jgi:SSS family solute:Na+ symporter
LQKVASVLSGYDIVVIIGSLIAVYLAARKGRASDTSGYVVAGRTLTLPFFVATLVATWYGAVLGSGEFILRYGISFILCFGVPYYVVALAYASFLAKRIHASKTVSIPDQFGRVYGSRGRTISAAILLVITTPASYQLMMGVLLTHLFQIPLLVSITLGTGVSIAYVFAGGLRSDVYANTVQFVLMYLGMAVLVAFAIATYGSPLQMWSALPAVSKEIPGTIGWSGILGWFIIALQTFIDPNFYARTLAATSPRIAGRGLAVSVACWMVFDLLQLAAGMYMIAFAPETDPTTSYLSFAMSMLPSAYRGLFVASLLAAVMSTLDGYALSSATMLAHDVMPKHMLTQHPLSRYRISLLIIAVAGSIVALCVPSIIDIIFYSASIAVSAVLVPLLMSFTSRAGVLRHSITWQLIVPAVAATLSLAADLGEPIFVGLIVSAGLALRTFLRSHHATTE